jgi:hypothetical protein
MARSSTTSGSNCRHRPARGLISIIAVSYATGEVAALSSRG